MVISLFVLIYSFYSFQIRDISLTPYGIPLQILLDAPQAADGDAVLQVVANDIQGQPPQPNQAILGGGIGDAFIEDGDYNQEIVCFSCHIFPIFSFYTRQ
jgi:hypothetical protein